ncbi:MAG: hypothetical protein ACLFVQ_03085 [Chitinispirillaceae bacterium]
MLKGLYNHLKNTILPYKTAAPHIMPYPLRQYLLESYESRRTNQLPRRLNRDIPIQIDDQDDNDSLTEFCNIFCMVKTNHTFRVELIGKFPITREMAELAEIYGGYADSLRCKVAMNLSVNQIDVLVDLAREIRKTAMMGPLVSNPRWYRISARTISSLHRFVRIIKEYSGRSVVPANGK